ncbi:MAG: CoA transferase [Chloroflexota bacterium]|nr:CoA transferase [Chloroflexota bacterium]
MARTALEGILVLDLGTGVAVPDGIRLLAELGANVIKIESSQNLDFVRTIAAEKNSSAGFNETNRNKRSIGVDLTTEKGKELAEKLIKMADVFAENLRGGVAKNLGFDYESIRRIKPDIIYLSSQGFGGDGPHSDYPAYGPMLSSGSGMLSIWKHPDDPYPVGSNSPLPDHMASKQCAIAILAALDYKRRTGKGQFIDMAQTEVAAALIGESFLDYTINKRVPEPKGNRSSYAAPHGAYPCDGIDNWVAISVFNDEEWHNFVKAIGNPDWAGDLKFATLLGRLKNVEELDLHISEWTTPQDAWDIQELLQKAGVPAGVVQRAPDTMKDPQIKHDNALVEIEHPIVGKRLYPNVVIKMSETPAVPSTSAPLLGQHTDEICRKLLQMSDDEIKKLKEEGILESPDS